MTKIQKTKKCKMKLIRTIAGYSIIVISLLTPFTNIVLVPIGLFVIGISLKDIKRKIKNKIRRSKK